MGTQGGGDVVHMGRMGGTQIGGDEGGQHTGTGATGGGQVPGQHTGDGDGLGQGPQQGGQGLQGLQIGKQGFGKGSYISITGPMQLFTHG